MRRRHLLQVLALAVFSVVAHGAEIQVANGRMAIDVPLSVFEADDRIVSGPEGALHSIRDLLELRTRHEYVDSARLVIERGGKRSTLLIGPAQHWGLHPLSAGEFQPSPRQRTPDFVLAAQVAEERGQAALLRWDGVAAEAAWREALAYRNRGDANDIAALKAALGVADALLLRRDLAAADAQFVLVDESLRKNWPASPLRLRAPLARGIITMERRDLPATETWLNAAEALATTVGVPALIDIEMRRVRGRYLYFRDDLEGARKLYERGYASAGKLVPGSAQEALLESNIGVVIWRQGDLAGAERRFAHAYDIAAREAPGSVLVAGLLMNLGTVHHLRRDYIAAERSYRRALDIFEATSRDSPETLRALTNLALAQGLGGRPREANAALERVLAAQLAAGGRRLDVAYTYNGLGLNYGRLEDWVRAAANYSEAIAIREDIGLLGIGLANTLTSRADARIQLAQLEPARADLVRSLAIYDRLAPASHARAEALHSLGTIAREQGDVASAMDFFRRAIDVLEAQQSHLGGSDEVRSSYSAYYSSFYKDYVELLLRRQRVPEAFETLERFRGRVLRAALAGEGRVLDALIPADLRAERDTLRASIDASYQQLQGIEKPAEEGEKVARLLADLESLHARDDLLAARIRERAPRVAELEQSQPASVAQVRAVLPRATALVSFAILPDAVEIFVIAPGGSGEPVHHARSPIKSAELRERVDRLAFLLSTPTDAADARAALERESNDLYQLLLAPVAAQLARFPNWVVVPDGPLHRLPFGALIERPGAPPHYLVESRVLTTVVSASVFGQLQRRERGRAFRRGLAAFGDPQLQADANLATSTARGDALRDELVRPLPWARQEVEDIGRLMGATAELYLGAAATEAKVREVAPRAPALHFASHGVLDEHSPLDSFLLLAGPVAGGGPADDGRLSAREVFELPPLAASLVTLSSCSTSASADNDGEGLIGLTRAFQANGADAVVSSLWKVSDRSTAELMLEFYRNWPAVNPDEALARAQRKFVSRHPFYWAAFEVSGARQRR